MPSTSPMLLPSTVTLLTCSPAAVLAVCEPCPSKSRGDLNSPGLALELPAASKYRAPITLLLQVTLDDAGSAGLVWQMPWNFAAMVASSERGYGSCAKLGLSGQ